jgi:hypothetical protein
MKTCNGCVCQFGLMHVINSQSKWAKMCADSHSLVNNCMGKHKIYAPL